MKTKTIFMIGVALAIVVSWYGISAQTSDSNGYGSFIIVGACTPCWGTTSDNCHWGAGVGLGCNDEYVSDLCSVHFEWTGAICVPDGGHPCHGNADCTALISTDCLSL